MGTETWNNSANMKVFLAVCCILLIPAIHGEREPKYPTMAMNIQSVGCKDYDVYLTPCTGASMTDSDDHCNGVKEKFGNDACKFHAEKYLGGKVAYCVAWSKCRDGTHNKYKDGETTLQMIDV